MENYARQAILLTYLAQVRQRRTLCLSFLPYFAAIMPHILLIKSRGETIWLFRVAAITGTARAAALFGLGTNTGVWLRACGNWRVNTLSISLRSLVGERN